jgi:trimethylamine corrinoid protein
MSFEELCGKAKESILEMEEDLALEILDEAISEGYDLMDLLAKGFASGMEELGQLFSDGEVFLPDLMYAADIMQQATEKIEANLPVGTLASKKGKMIMATVEGDVHDIGKGICCSILKTKGIEVYDLGRDVASELIVDKAEEYGVEIIGLSALVTTTMGAQEAVIKILEERGIRDKYKVMIGGAPVTTRFAEKIGADAYTEDAVECAEKALEYFAS